MFCQGCGEQGWKGGLVRLKCFGKKQVFEASALQVLFLRYWLNAADHLPECYGIGRFSKLERRLPAGHKSVYSCVGSRLNLDSILSYL